MHRSTTEVAQFFFYLTVGQHASEAKVSDLSTDLSLAAEVNEYVFRLQVPVDHIALVHLAHAVDDLSEDGPVLPPIDQALV